ncbi:MAG: VCBS repeat-containing protein [Gemmataceae bacterium]
MVGDFNNDAPMTSPATTPGTGRWWVGLSTGTGFALSVGQSTGRLTAGRPTPWADFNGDGKDDVASYNPNNGAWVGLAGNGGFSVSHWQPQHARRWETHVIDYNGDGKDDIASYHPDNGAQWVNAFRGSDFNVTLWDVYQTRTGWQTQLSGDFGGDGKDDIAQFHPINGTWWVGTAAVPGSPIWQKYHEQGAHSRDFGLAHQ